MNPIIKVYTDCTKVMCAIPKSKAEKNTANQPFLTFSNSPNTTPLKSSSSSPPS